MPAMAALLSGSYPDRCGVLAHEPGTTFASWPGTTLAEAAGKAGLATAAVVANPWLARATTGFDRGFDEFSRIYRPDQAPGSSNAAAVTDDAIRLLDLLRDRRFLLWVHYFDPHMPYEPPAEFARAAGAQPGPSRVMSDFNTPGRDLGRIYRGEGYDAAEIEQARRLYDGEVRFVDHQIGRLLDRLEALGLAGGTLVVLASDHGESLGEHGLYFAHDYTLYDELTRVALLVRGPGVAAGERDDDVSLLDVAPTVCRLAALDCGNAADGRDLFADAPPPRTLFGAATPLRSRGTAFDRLQIAGTDGRWTMALDGTSKLLRIPTGAGAELELYDLRHDPRESANIAASSGARAEELAAKLAAWTEAMEVARPAPASPGSARQQRRDRRALRSLGYLQ
jgi:arylsulfatase